MMKKTNFGPLLLLLLLAVTSRNSCANPFESPYDTMGGAPADMSSTIADAMKEEIANDKMEGADILTAARTWLKDNKTRSSHFDESILDLEKKIIKLPSKLAENREQILASLYKSQDRLKHLDTVLELAATTLKDICIHLIKMCNDNESSEGALIYITGRFVGYAELVNKDLKNAVKITKEIKDILSASSAFSKAFNAEQDYEKKKTKVDEIMFIENEPYPHNVILLLYTSKDLYIPAATEEAVADRKETEFVFETQEQFQINIDKQSELINNGKTVHTSATTLFLHVEDVKDYLTRHLDLITIWQKNLEATILDNTDITSGDIKYNITWIQYGLKALIKACDDYLAHESPDILQSRES